MVPTTVLFTGEAALRTTVVPELVSVVWLVLLPLFLPALATGTAAAALVPLPVAAVELADEEAVTFRDAVARVDFAFSTMFVRILTAPPAVVGTIGFSGEMGLAR
jgi:hypothetical protein